MLFRLIVAGIFAIPPLLLSVIMAPILALLSIPSCLLLLNSNPSLSNKKSSSSSSASNRTTERHVIITGGSSGIGLAIAMAAVADSIKSLATTKARIILLARSMDKLNAAKQQILTATAAAGTTTKSSVSVDVYSVDVSDPMSLEKIASDVFPSSDTTPTSTTSISHYLFCCAGEPIVQYAHKIPLSEYTKLVQINQLGSIYTVQTFLPYISQGTITFTSSMVGQIGVYGYAAYSPTKFAIRGYAEALHMELQSSSEKSIAIQVAYPPDTDTPGYVLENISKPLETKLISSAANTVATSTTVGTTMWHQATKKTTSKSVPFNVYFDLDGFLLCTFTNGFAPVSTLHDAIAQVSILPITRWIGLFYLYDWHRMIRNCAKTKTNQNSISTTTESKDSATGKTSPTGTQKVD